MEAVIDHAPAPDSGTDRLVAEPLDLDHIAFSLTNRCHLRCVYCPQGTHPDQFHADTPAGQIELVREFVARHGIRRISLGYYGETMLIPGWQDVCRPLLELGADINFVSSFSRVMTTEETDVVARFASIQISIDTVDPALLKEIRKAVDVRTILFNTHLIRAHAIAHGLPMPRLIWTAVLSDRVMEGFPDLVAMAVSSGITEMNCNDLAYIGEDREIKVRHPVDMEHEAFARGFKALHRGRRLALRHGTALVVQEIGRLNDHGRRVMGRDDWRMATRTLTEPDELDPRRPIYIYGAGAAGRALRANLSGFTVRGYIDSRQSGECEGLPVLALDDYVAARKPDDQILIASMYADEIEATLLKLGIENYLHATGVGRSRGVPAAVRSGHNMGRHGIQGAYSYAGDETNDLPPGMTRLCTAPWTEVFLDPKGEVYSCCMRGHVMGRLAGGTGIEEVVRNEEYQQLRRQLLTGEDLPPECLRCGTNRAVRPDELRAHLSALAARRPAGRS